MKIYRIGLTLAALNRCPKPVKVLWYCSPQKSWTNVLLCRDWRVLCITPLLAWDA